MERIKPVNRKPGSGALPEPEQSQESRGRSRRARKKTITSFPTALMLAAEQVGEDGYGRNGLVGYLRQIARTQPEFFLRMLVRICLVQDAREDENPLDKEYETVEEAKEAWRKAGIDLDAILR